MFYPRLFPVRQRFQGPRLDDVGASVHAELAKLRLGQQIAPGQRVAITAGSRGIANIALIVKAIVDHVRSLGGEPFIVPAMGSHGGATAAGQVEILATYGITEEYCGCPLLASMDTVVVCQSDEGFDVHFDRHAFEADHVIVCGRIKLHTSFHGEIQSGLMKMLLIGLGKHRGACIYHRAFRDFSFDQIIRGVASTVVKNCRIAAGVAIVENGYEQTALVEAVRPEDFLTREPELLKLSAEWIAKLPFDRADVLVVDQIGKNISGTGMDTNVVGRKSDVNAALEHEWPKIEKIVVRGLTPETHGNATGIGLADLTTQRVVDQINYQAMRVNCVTSGRTAVGMLPVYFPTERESIEAALTMIGLKPAAEARLVRIPNTLELGKVVCSEIYLAEAHERPELEVIGELYDMTFNDKGELADQGC